MDEPVAWVDNLDLPQPHCVTDLRYCSVMQHERGEHLKYVPLYTTLQAGKWQGLTEDEIKKLVHMLDWTAHWSAITFAFAIEALLKEKNK